MATTRSRPGWALPYLSPRRSLVIKPRGPGPASGGPPGPLPLFLGFGLSRGDKQGTLGPAYARRRWFVCCGVPDLLVFYKVWGATTASGGVL